MSIRITKAMAQEAAKSISSAYKKEEYEKLENQRREIAEYLVKQYVPNPVRAVVKEFRKFFTATNYVSIRAYSPDDICLSTISQYINILLPNGGSFIVVKYKEYQEIEKLKDKMKMIEYERKELEKSATQTLVTLGTVARVAKELPEALEYLKYQAEKDKKHLPERNYTELRQTLSLIKKSINHE